MSDNNYIPPKALTEPQDNTRVAKRKSKLPIKQASDKPASSILNVKQEGVVGLQYNLSRLESYGDTAKYHKYLNSKGEYSGKGSIYTSNPPYSIEVKDLAHGGREFDYKTIISNHSPNEKNLSNGIYNVSAFDDDGDGNIDRYSYTDGNNNTHYLENVNDNGKDNFKQVTSKKFTKKQDND